MMNRRAVSCGALKLSSPNVVAPNASPQITEVNTASAISLTGIDRIHVRHRQCIALATLALVSFLQTVQQFVLATSIALHMIVERAIREENVIPFE
jgi:hypothetical protein